MRTENMKLILILTGLQSTDPIPPDLVRRINRIEEMLRRTRCVRWLTPPIMAVVVEAWERESRVQQVVYDDVQDYYKNEDPDHEPTAEDYAAAVEPEPPAEIVPPVKRPEPQPERPGLARPGRGVLPQAERGLPWEAGREGLEWKYDYDGHCWEAKSLVISDYWWVIQVLPDNGLFHAIHGKTRAEKALPTLALAKAWCQEQDTKLLTQQAAEREGKV